MFHFEFQASASANRTVKSVCPGALSSVVPSVSLDVIATPTMTAPPKPLDAGGSIATPMYAEWAAPLYPFNLTGHPALSVPAGFTAGGLPVGLQLIGPWFAERQLLRLAALLEAINPWHERRPPLHRARPRVP